MYIPLELIVFGALGLICWLYSSGRIVVRRKPKIKLNGECRKYYDECEKLLLPFYEKHRELYSGILSDVETRLDLFKQMYEQERVPDRHEIVKPLFETKNVDRYYIWAIEMVCMCLRERRNVAYSLDKKYKELCDNLYSQREELRNTPGITIPSLPVCWIEKN